MLVDDIECCVVEKISFRGAICVSRCDLTDADFFAETGCFVKNGVWYKRTPY